MNKISLDLNNYPNLKQLYDKEPTKFSHTLKGMMKHADTMIEKGYPKQSEAVYNREYTDLLDEVMSTFFDIEGIANQHQNIAEREGLKALREDLHPLAIFTNDAPVYNSHGQNVSPYEWIRQDKFDIKHWLLGLFYAARFVSWKEFADYLTLGQYDLVEKLQVENLDKILQIQPALKYQETNGIPKGKLIEGTGLFDCGTFPNGSLTCPSCKEIEGNTLKDHSSGISSCTNCKAGFRK